QGGSRPHRYLLRVLRRRRVVGVRYRAKFGIEHVRALRAQSGGLGSGQRCRSVRRKGTGTAALEPARGAWGGWGGGGAAAKVPHKVDNLWANRKSAAAAGHVVRASVTGSALRAIGCSSSEVCFKRDRDEATDRFLRLARELRTFTQSRTPTVHRAPRRRGLR